MEKEIFYFRKDEEGENSGEAVKIIVDKLRQGEWRSVLMNESIGGNAGDNKAAINAYVEKDTGKIIIFGNMQNLPKGIVSDPDNVEVTFLYNYGNLWKRIRNKNLEIEPEFFESVISPGASSPAMENLKKAIDIFNEEYKKSQQQN